MGTGKMLRKSGIALASALLATAAAQAGWAAQPQASVAEGQRLLPVEEFRLANGMKVIFHIDRSDPVVAVALNAHVGSAREKPGRTGFATLFEHLHFLH